MRYLFELSIFRMRFFWLVPGVVLLLNGCANRPVLTESDREQRDQLIVLSEKAVADISFWCVNGRSVARYDDSGWQANLKWCVDDDKITLNISGPININRVFIKFQRGALWLQESSTEITISRSPRQLLQSRLGFSVPLTAIRYWLLGMAEPDIDARIQVNELGQTEQINQLGWVITLSDYTSVNQFMLPRKIKIKKDRIRLKIVVDEWELSNE